MIGLLYKDFVVVKGKTHLTVLFMQFALVSFLCLVPMGKSAEEGMGAIGISILVIALIACCVSLVSNISPALMQSDDGRNQKQYYLSLPIDKDKYVASKYIFLLAAFYIMVSVLDLEIFICRSRIDTDQLTFVAVCIPMILSICLVVCALEMPVYFAFGSGGGKVVKEGSIFILLLLVAIYLLFGDLTVFGDGITNLMDYLFEHQEILMAAEISIPAAALGVYGVSYGISRYLFVKKEWEDD